MNERTDGRIHRFSLGAMALLVAICFTIGLAAQPSKKARAQDKGEAKQTAQDKRDAEIYGKLAACWQSFYAGKYQEAAKQAESLTKLEPRYRWVMTEAAHLGARAYFAAGTKQSVAKAQQIWKHIERVDTSNATKIRLQIVKSLASEADAQAPNVKPDAAAAKLKAAIDLLEPLLKDHRWNIEEVEAALVLSNLYSNRAVGRFDDARKTLDYIVSYLGDANNIQRMELPPGLEKPYIAAAREALKRLKYQRDAGREEFEAAERLRQQEKYAEALRAYTAIARDFADTDYGPRSLLHIGDCYAGQRQVSKAIDHWKRFITPLPAGNHRALAYIRIIDYSLEDALDINEASKYAELARASLPTALADEKANASWSAAQFDIQLRIGLVSFIAGKNEQAAEAWTAAAKLTDKKPIQESLDALIAAAKSGKGVMPDDVRGSDSGEMKAAGAASSPKGRCALVISMGVIHLVAGRLDNADSCFDRVLGTPTVPAKPGVPGQPARPAMPGATPAQLAFATFGRGAVQHARNKPEEAKEFFLASIKAFGDGSWHDESVFRVASIAQSEGNSKFGKASEIASKPGQPAKSLTPAEKEAAAKAEKERLAALLKAKGEALAYWQELIKRYPSSPRCEQAYYQAGVLLCEIAEASPPAQSEKLWKEAATLLSRFCELYPKSPLAGDAYVRQVDIGLQRMFDIDLSRQLAASAVDWAKAQPEFPSDDPPPKISDAWRALTKPTGPIEVRLAVYEIYLRAGLVAYLDQRYEAAQGFFESAKPMTPPRDFVVVEGRIPTGIESITTAAREKKALTAQEVLDGDAKVRLILQLADIYLVAGSYEKSLELATMITADLKKSASVSQCSWAHRGRAMALSSLRLKLDAKPEFVAAQEANPTAPWASECLFLAGTIVHNHAKNPKEAIGVFEEVVRQYPTSEFAAKAAYFVGVIHEWNGQWSQAKTAYQRVIRDYPESRWASAAMDFHMKKVDAALAAADTNKPREK